MHLGTDGGDRICRKYVPWTSLLRVVPRAPAGRRQPAPRRGDEILARQVGLHSVKVPDRGRRGGPVQDGLDAVVRRLCAFERRCEALRDVMRVA